VHRSCPSVYPSVCPQNAKKNAIFPKTKQCSDDPYKRPVCTGRLYGLHTGVYGRFVHTTGAHGPYNRAVCTGRVDRAPKGRYSRPVQTARLHEPFVRVVYTGAFFTPAHARTHPCRRLVHVTRTIPEALWLRCFIHRLISPMHRTDVCIDASNFQPMNGIKRDICFNMSGVSFC